MTTTAITIRELGATLAYIQLQREKHRSTQHLQGKTINELRLVLEAGRYGAPDRGLAIRLLQALRKISDQHTHGHTWHRMGDIALYCGADLHLLFPALLHLALVGRVAMTKSKSRWMVKLLTRDERKELL